MVPRVVVIGTLVGQRGEHTVTLTRNPKGHTVTLTGNPGNPLSLGRRRVWQICSQPRLRSILREIRSRTACGSVFRNSRVWGLGPQGFPFLSPGFPWVVGGLSWDTAPRGDTSRDTAPGAELLVPLARGAPRVKPTRHDFGRSATAKRISAPVTSTLKPFSKVKYPDKRPGITLRA